MPDRAPSSVAPDPSKGAVETGLAAVEVVKHYGGVKALKGVSLRVDPGAILGLIGPNGSGKTTLLNCLSGVTRITSGAVRFDGAPIQDRALHQIARGGVARTFQSIRLFGRLSVLENVAVAISASTHSPLRRARPAARELLAEFAIGGLADVYAENLSYGDRRRVEIARALGTAPRVLLLDEPAAGMNDVESARLGELLDEIRQRRGCGILLVDHDLRLIMRHCDRIHVLNEGATIADGSPSAVQQDPRVISAYIGEPATTT